MEEYMEEKYSTLPDEVKSVLNNFVSKEGTYENCEELVRDLENIGWTMEYGLDADPYNLRRLPLISENNRSNIK